MPGNLSLFQVMFSVLLIFQQAMVGLCAEQGDDSDFARYRGFGHMSGLIGNYLSRPRTPFTMKLLGEYRLTFYWITRAVASDSAAKVNILIRSPDTGEEHPVLVSRSFKRRLDREGTGILEDGRLINIIRRDERKRYLDISTVYPTGLGSANNPLTPFISVAISDRNRQLAFGDTIYIPGVQGLPLPDGGIHDGIFNVADTGYGIRTDQIDIFVFIKNNWPDFQRRLKAHLRKFFVYKIFRRPDPR